MVKFLKGPAKVAKFIIKPMVNVPAWMGLRSLTDDTRGVVNMLKPLYKKPAAKRVETFEQAMQRLNLTEDDIKTRNNNLRWQSWLYALLGVAALGYMFYLLWDFHITSGILALAVSGFFGVKFMICRFWMFQIKHRRLGCTLKEWFSNKVEVKKS